jgi:AcrR family transcriptional regulator
LVTKLKPVARAQQRAETREVIREAAMTLFADRGFDAVTVADITREAGVARSTFFRYFPDKADVLFEDDSASHLLLGKAVAGAARLTSVPLGDSLDAMLRVARAAVLVLADSKSIQAMRYPMREQLIAETPQLQICSLVKERGYTDALEAALVEQGATSLTACQAALVATACYATGYAEAFTAPQLLPAAVERAFDKLFALGSGAGPR